MSGSDRNPYSKPTAYNDVRLQNFVEEYHNPEVEIVERPEMCEMVAISDMWDRDTNMPIKEGTVFWGNKGEFYDLAHAVLRYLNRNEPEMIERYTMGSIKPDENGVEIYKRDYVVLRLLAYRDEVCISEIDVVIESINEKLISDYEESLFYFSLGDSNAPVSDDLNRTLHRLSQRGKIMLNADSQYEITQDGMEYLANIEHVVNTHLPKSVVDRIVST